MSESTLIIYLFTISSFQVLRETSLTYSKYYIVDSLLNQNKIICELKLTIDNKDKIELARNPRLSDQKINTTIQGT